MFPKVAEKFFKERSKGPVDAQKTFGAKPASESAPASAPKSGSYTVSVNGTPYSVTTSAGSDTIIVNGTSYNVSFGDAAPSSAPVSAPVVTGGADIKAPVAGTLLRYVAQNGAEVKKGDTVLMIESMKMELEVKAPSDGKINFIAQPGAQIAAGQVIATLGGTVAAAPAPKPAAAAPVSKTAPVSPAASTGGKPVNAPVAGTLLRYEVGEGDQVKADTTVIMIESMKMELEIKAGAAGAVHFLVQPGTQITAGQALAEIK